MDVLTFKGDLSLFTTFQKLPTLNVPKNYYPIFILLSIFLISLLVVLIIWTKARYLKIVTCTLANVFEGL